MAVVVAAVLALLDWLVVHLAVVQVALVLFQALVAHKFNTQVEAVVVVQMQDKQIPQVVLVLMEIMVVVNLKTHNQHLQILAVVGAAQVI
jgi:hypothetical protein